MNVDMISRHLQNQRGFTIVELLVVIVVIGILASVTVVAYNGIQDRAKNAARLANVKQITQLARIARSRVPFMDMMNSMNNDGPGSWYRACLGTNYPDLNGDGVGDCGMYGSTPYVSESAAFNTILQNAGEIPKMHVNPVAKADDGDIVYGPYIGSAWVDDSYVLLVEYLLHGNAQDCKMAPLLYYSASTPTFTAPSGQASKYSVTGTGVTECHYVFDQHKP